MKRLLQTFLLVSCFFIFGSSHVFAKTIFVGDSRTVNMSNWVESDKDVIFIAKSGQGYHWFVESAIEEVNTMIEKGDDIIIWLGVNDYRSTKVGKKPWDKYANTMNHLAEQAWSDCNIHVASVGYVDRTRIQKYYKKDNRSNVSQIGTAIKVKGIKEYNKKLKEKLNKSIHWIDLSEVIGIKESDGLTKESIWLTRKNGKKDGLHYGKKKTKEIYHYIIKSIK